eukprot:jgi/Tetstr1/461391/TSEL_006503.t1
MSLCRELGQAGRLGWCAGCGVMLAGLVASEASLVTVDPRRTVAGRQIAEYHGDLRGTVGIKGKIDWGLAGLAARDAEAAADSSLLRSLFFTPRRALAVS